MKIVSLFANIGVAETYLETIGFKVVLANEIESRRMDLYSRIFQHATSIHGDISSKNIYQTLIDAALKLKIDLVMATPPCQGMSTAGQMKDGDDRNNLIIPTISFIQDIFPKYVFLENVPRFLKTYIRYMNKNMTMPELIHKKLGGEYNIETKIVNMQNYSVPQTRERAIMLMSRKDSPKKWGFPPIESKLVTMHDAIGDLPPLDPYVKDISQKEHLRMFPDFIQRKYDGLNISKWHIAPHHVKRQVVAMMHTPTGQTAFNNPIYKPIKANGNPIKGFLNTYKRQHWNKPAYAITMDNVKISSQNNVHPGRLLGKNIKSEDIYSDPRTLSIYEIMKLMTLPEDWNIPKGVSGPFLRRIIGEGIPPLFVKKVFQQLIS